MGRLATREAGRTAGRAHLPTAAAAAAIPRELGARGGKLVGGTGNSTAGSLQIWGPCSITEDEEKGPDYNLANSPKRMLSY